LHVQKDNIVVSHVSEEETKTKEQDCIAEDARIWRSELRSRKIMKSFFKQQQTVSCKEKYRSRARGVSPEGGRESRKGRICDKGRFKPGVKG